MTKGLVINPAAYQELFAIKRIQDKKLDEFRAKINHLTELLERSRKREQQLQDTVRALRDGEHVMARRASWGNL